MGGLGCHGWKNSIHEVDTSCEFFRTKVFWSLRAVQLDANRRGSGERRARETIRPRRRHTPPSRCGGRTLNTAYRHIVVLLDTSNSSKRKETILLYASHAASHLADRLDHEAYLQH